MHLRFDVDIISFTKVLENSDAIHLFHPNTKFEFHLVLASIFDLRYLLVFFHHIHPHAQGPHRPVFEQRIWIVKPHSLNGLHEGSDQVIMIMVLVMASISFATKIRIRIL